MNEITYTMLNTFLACRKQYEYRYVRKIAPVFKPTALTFGACVHAGLESWLKFDNLPCAIHAMECYAEKHNMPPDDLEKARALLTKYAAFWDEDKDLFDVEQVEYVFKTKLKNPKTNRASRTTALCGKVDALIRINGELFILEHKTTSALDDAYLSRILIDSQISIYANAIAQVYGEPVAGAVYDILVKPRTRFKSGESEEQFEARKADLMLKSKTGKTAARRKERESLETFYERCLNDIDQNETFMREVVRFSESDLKEHLAEVWSVNKELTKGLYYRNTGSCSRYGRPCPYLELCRAHGDVCQCGGLYVEQEPNQELKEAEND